MKTCSVSYCRKAHKARGMCQMHYWRWQQKERRRQAFQRIPKVKHKTFDLKTLGAVGWSVRP